MKRLISALRSARWFELCIALAAAAAILALCMGNSGGGKSNENERRMEHILSGVEGAGRVEVMLSCEGEDYSGAVVSCSGADDISVVLQLQRAVQTLTGLELEQIEIIKSGR